MLWEPIVRVEEAAGSRSHLTRGNHSESPVDLGTVCSSPGDNWEKGGGRQRPVSTGQGGLEDPRVGREKDQNSTDSSGFSQ